MLLKYPDGRPFATGAADYNASPEDRFATLIYLQAEVENYGCLPTTLVLDTGAPCFICTPELAENIGSLSGDEAFVEDVRIRGNIIRGRLHRIRVYIWADEGDSLDLGVLAFVPESADGLNADLLTYSRLGLAGCLTSINIAIAGNEQRVYWM